MAKVDILDILKSKKMTPSEIAFDMMQIPPINYYLTPQDIEGLRNIATSTRLSSKINLKYKMIDDIMKARGFKRFSAGTNRVVYSFLEDTRFLVKIAVDKVGMQDNPLEFQNQFLLKPFVAKTFYTSACGTVGFAERVLPIKSKGEFKEIAEDVFDILVNKFLGKYVVADVGTKYFLNWGVRAGCSPVLLDYPYIYNLDGKKLYCTKINPFTNTTCDGVIDYDKGFNNLVCSKCGKIYLASDLRDDSPNNKIVIKGGLGMKVILRKGNEVISETIPSDDIIRRPKKNTEIANNNVKVSVKKGNKDIFLNKKEEEKIEVATPVAPKVKVELNHKNEEPNYEEAEVEETTNEVEDTETVETIDAEEVIEAAEAEEEDEEPEFLKRLRDSNGRFISGSNREKSKKKNKSNKTGSTFIPSNKRYEY